MSELATPLVSLSNNLAELVDHAAQGIVTIRGARRWPLSGLHWRPGIIVTAEEGLERDEDLTIVFPDGRTVSAALVGRDPTTDIAALRFAADGDVFYFAVGDNDDVTFGEPTLKVLG